MCYNIKKGRCDNMKQRIEKLGNFACIVFTICYAGIMSLAIEHSKEMIGERITIYLLSFYVMIIISGILWITLAYKRNNIIFICIGNLINFIVINVIELTIARQYLLPFFEIQTLLYFIFCISVIIILYSSKFRR